MARLFGTDGVRGIANQDLTCDLALRIGAAGAFVLTSEVRVPNILIGSDTRKSCDMLVAALSAGICSVGGQVLNVGVIPTPAMAYLVREYEADAAVMVSASHNSMEFNGIKWFDRHGCKLSDGIEDRIEALIQDPCALPAPIKDKVGNIVDASRAQEDYINFLIHACAVRLDGMRIVLDCANGASSAIAKRVFLALGADVLPYYDEPDGCNINENCGSTHISKLQDLVREKGADMGFAFDGDADRVIACDERGNVVDGDRIMGILALDMRERGALKNDLLVLTVMSNLGLKKRMQEEGIKILETAVGDRYVLEAMMEHGCSLGGEQSGHIILLDENTTGDGILSALKLAGVAFKTGKPLSSLAKGIPVFPQILINVKLENDQKDPAMGDELFQEKIREATLLLGGDGRVLVRASGTEPLIRVMLEGQDEEQITNLGIGIAQVLKEKFNAQILRK